MRHRIYVLLLCLLFCGGTLQAQRRHKKLREVDNIDITFCEPHLCKRPILAGSFIAKMSRTILQNAWQS